VSAAPPPTVPLDFSLLKPGLRLAVALSGGADSVALLRILASRTNDLGIVLHAAHLHHGLRGEEADGDLEFSRQLASGLALPFHEARVDTRAEARAGPESQKRSETIEEAARRLRYGWFRQLMAAGEIDAVATAHTLDDQAETVVAKFLRGAWTEGLAGIASVLKFPEGPVLRPLLAVTRTEIETYLEELGQAWREDSSNRHLSFARNRIRHELLPLLESWNPRLREHLAHMAAIARDEEAWWQAELARLAPQLLLPGLPTRGGGRAAGPSPAAGLSLDTTRLAALSPAMLRRLLRYVAEQLDSQLDFATTEALRSMALAGRAGRKLSLPNGLLAERTARELRFTQGSATASPRESHEAIPEYSIAIPGEIDAPAFGLRLRLGLSAAEADSNRESSRPRQAALLRNWRPGDRVILRYSAGPRKVKEVLERLRVTGLSRARWPVLELDGRIVWMQGVEVEPYPALTIAAAFSGNRAADPPAVADSKQK